MKKQCRRDEKLNNAGMTLVEILVAMVILAVAIVPLMFSFVNVSKYSARGRAVQQTTGVAQTIIENCKAYNLEDITELVGNGTFLPSTAGEYADAATYDQWTTPNAGDVSLEDYHCVIQNLDIDNTVYGATINMTPLKVQDVMEYQDKNDKLDGIFMESTTSGSAADATDTMEKFKKETFDAYIDNMYNVIKFQYELAIDPSVAGNPPFDMSKEELFYYVYNKGWLDITRTMTISASNAGVIDSASVSYVYAFTLDTSTSHKLIASDGTEVPLDFSIINAATAYSLKSKTINGVYSNASSYAGTHVTKLENIYFYYYPAYDAEDYVAYPCTKDIIVIDNARTNAGTSNPIDVHLIKQKSPEVTDPNLLKIVETSYDVKVQGTLGEVNLHHNFETNLGNESGSTMWDPSGDLSYDTSDALLHNLGKTIKTEKQVLMYNIVVDIYREPKETVDGSGHPVLNGEKVLTMDGTKLDW